MSRYCFLAVLLGLQMLALARAEVLYRESELATLFTTPEARHRIDMQRSGKATVAGGESGNQTRPGKIRVNGVVRSSNGKSVVWVNGRLQDKNSTVKGVKLLGKRGNAQSVVMLVDGKLVRVKPGEAWSGAEQQ